MSNNDIIESQKQNHWTEEVKEKHADTLRKLNEHENNLLNMRFTWFTTLQGLLFASLGFIWKENLQLIVILIASMGIIVAISFISVMKLTWSAYANLSKWWSDNLSDYDGPPLKAIELNKKMTLSRAFRPWRILPWVFIAGWAIILTYRLAI